MSVQKILKAIKALQLPNGGFPYFPGEEARPDATAWAILGMSSFPDEAEKCRKGREFLQSKQQHEGQICVTIDHPEASWPTSLAILAWENDPVFQSGQDHAIQFLLDFTGNHFANPDPRIVGHDTTIRGWPWVADTHSWVVPTGMALMALRTAGQNLHERVIEGQDMLLNRQLPLGGWNYGSTMVFGRPTPPLPESTAIALQALANHLPQKRVQHSLEYLEEELPHIKTPLSLGWSILALSAWGLRPQHSLELVFASWQRQDRYGTYSLPSLALLLCAAQFTGGLSAFLQSPNEFIHAKSRHSQS